MKSSFWYAIGALLLAAPAHAQTSAQALAGIWQGVESDKDKPGEYWPAELRLQKSQGAELFGVLYQELGGRPSTSVTFQMRGRSVAPGLRLEHGPKLDETGRTLRSYWCDGFITFTYDPALEKLTGHATYRPQGDCSVGTFIFYRVRLKSAATVPAGVESTLRVSGHKVLWYADAELQQPVNAGNTFRTTLNKTTTFYITQAYYPTKESATVPITIKVTGTRPKTPAPAPPTPPAAPPDTARPAPAAPLISTTPVVLPTVLFKVGKPELLPESGPALDQLAAELKSRPTLQIRVSGHADKVGEPDKNQVLSEQRAEAVKTYLVNAGIAPERIRTIGYGDSRPLHPSPDVRNRRVEVEEVK